MYTRTHAYTYNFKAGLPHSYFIMLRSMSGVSAATSSALLSLQKKKKKTIPFCSCNSSTFKLFSPQQMSISSRRFTHDPKEPPLPKTPPNIKPSGSAPPEVPRTPNVPDFDPFPPEKAADPPPLSSGPKPDFPGPPTPSPPAPDGPLPPIPSPRGPDVPPGPPDYPPHAPDYIPPRPPGVGPPHPTPLMFHYLSPVNCFGSFVSSS